MFTRIYPDRPNKKDIMCIVGIEMGLLAAFTTLGILLEKMDTFVVLHISVFILLLLCAGAFVVSPILAFYYFFKETW